MDNGSDTAPQDGCPYGDLYIYYLQGRVKDAEAIFGADFIGNWEEDGFSFLFFSRPCEKAVADLVGADDGLTLIDAYTMPYDQWQGARLEPFEAGGLCITPPWTAAKAGPGQGRILLDPGVVFGAGTHTTTRDCLEALHLACGDGAVESVLDLGTGTGVLALAALRLGCRRAMAVDFNLLAARTALGNARLNGLADRIGVVQGRAEEAIAWPADLVVANIHFDVMKDLVAAPGFLAKKRFVLSGLLRSQTRDIEEKLRSLPVTLHRRWDRDGVWHTVYGTVEGHVKG